MISKKSHLHEACERNGFCMPSAKSSICTIEFMMAVRRRECYCPTYTEMSQRACPKPPTVKIVKKAVVEALGRAVFNPRCAKELADQCRILLKFLEVKEADRRWLLIILATVEPDHDFFGKSYVAPKRVTKPSVVPQEIEDDGFFYGLP